MSASLIGLRVKHFQTIINGVDVARARASFESAPGPLSGSEDEAEQSLSALPLKAAGPSGHTNSPHPSSRKGHLPPMWSSSFLLSGLILNGFMLLPRLAPGPLELGTINPDAVRITPAGVPSHDRLLHPAAPGNLQPTP
jgi:hypothetical protein